MQIELHKIVAAKPQAVFRTIADIVNWPQIIRSVAAVELLTHGRVRVKTRVRLTGCLSSPARAAQDFIAPFMQINLRDELERDFADFAAAASELDSRPHVTSIH